MSNFVVRRSKIVCQAATNVPGEVPSSASTSSGMSTYERIIETLTTLFPLWVCQKKHVHQSSHFQHF